MIIRRTVNGEEFTFELTDEELSGAYNARLHELDMSYCAEDYDGWSDEEIIEDCGVNRAQFEAVLDKIADEMRYRIDMYGSSSSNARDAAIRDVIYDEYDIELKY